MTFTTLDNVLWAASFLGHVALIIVLALRKRLTYLPVFTGFVVFAVLRTIILFLVSRFGTRHGYFLAYWITGFLDYAFQVALIFGIARDVLRPGGQWILGARNLFLFCGLAAVLAAAAFSMLVGPPNTKGLDLWDIRTTVFTTLLTIQLFLAMSFTANSFWLIWRSPTIAVGQGISLWAIASLMEEAWHVVFGWDRNFAEFAHIRHVLYVCMLVYWMVAFWLPEKVRPPLTAEQQALLIAVHEQVKYDLTNLEGPSE